MYGKILQVFLNVDLRSGHKGLSDLAHKYKISTKKIEPGSYLIFINCKRDKLKLYASNEVIAYLRMPKGQVINMLTIKSLPKVFNGTSINYKEALKEAVELGLKNKSKEITVY